MFWPDMAPMPIWGDGCEETLKPISILASENALAATVKVTPNGASDDVEPPTSGLNVVPVISKPQALGEA